MAIQTASSTKLSLQTRPSIYIKEFVPLLIPYRPVGGGQKDRNARFDQTMISDPRAWLEDRLGPLAKYELLVEYETSDTVAEPVE